MFKPGDRVICIDADFSTFLAAHQLCEGQSYVVRASGDDMVWLEDILNGFYARRFRSVDDTPFHRSVRDYINQELSS